MVRMAPFRARSHFADAVPAPPVQDALVAWSAGAANRVTANSAAACLGVEHTYWSKGNEEVAKRGFMDFWVFKGEKAGLNPSRARWKGQIANRPNCSSDSS